MLFVIADISKKYEVKRLQEEDILDVYDLCRGNTTYYNYIKAEASPESVRRQLEALPPGKSYADKYCVGFYAAERLIAVMDLIVQYPNEDTAFIGLLMVNQAFQGQGIGVEIMKSVLEYLGSQRYLYAELGYIKENVEAERFWLKSRFVKVGEVTQGEQTIVRMRRELQLV